MYLYEVFHQPKMRLRRKKKLTQAKKVKQTRTGEMFERDAIVFHKMLQEYRTNNETNQEAHSTYPSKN